MILVNYKKKKYAISKYKKKKKVSNIKKIKVVK
jgi:hypothetical protein